MLWEWIQKVFIVDLFVEMDWRQFIPSIIATFVGIFVPLLIQKKKEKSDRRSEALQHLKSIKAELEKISHDINNLASPKNMAYLTPIKTPVWDGLLNTNGMILLLELRQTSYAKTNKRGQPHYEEIDTNTCADWYQRIFSVYSGIDEYNQWWNLYSDKYFSMGTDPVLNDVVDGIGLLGEKLCSNDLGSSNKDSENEVNIPRLISLIDEFNKQFDKPKKKGAKQPPNGC